MNARREMMDLQRPNTDTEGLEDPNDDVTISQVMHRVVTFSSESPSCSMP